MQPHEQYAIFGDICKSFFQHLFNSDGNLPHCGLITETRDSFGHSTGYTYAKNGAVQQTVSTSYGDDGRINSAGFLHGGEMKQFGYEYLQGTNLLQVLTKPNGMTLTQSYEAQRDLLTGMAYHCGSTLVAQRTYTYDILGRPTARNTARQSSVVNDTFSHNSRSELVDAQVNGKEYEYVYDNIGNRQSSIEDNNAIIYDSNELNQYTSISENGAPAFVPQFDADGNQTLIKTSTGIWSAVYNAENRPASFTNSESNTIVECAYDSMGRRAYKKVTTNGSVTLHQRYIYRGYLQIACIDLTRSHHPGLWLITWDPTQPAATRPLAIQKDGTWYTYGWDLTKNVCEVFGTSGNIATAYTYAPYGQVTAEGDVTQPFQWSSEVMDAELALMYYNYRHYNPMAGRWLCRDGIKTTSMNYSRIYSYNNYVCNFDFLGLDVKKVKAGADMGTGTTKSEKMLFSEVANIAGNGKLTTTGQELLDYLKELSKPNTCISLFTIAGHGWMSYDIDAQIRLDNGDGIPGGGDNAEADGVGFYLENGYSGINRESGGRTVKDLEILIGNNEVCFCNECRIQIHSCNISSDFAEELARITKCSVVYAQGSCSIKGKRWHSGVGEEPGDNDESNGFYITKEGEKSVHIGRYYTPKK